jgi:glycine oxidase
MRADILIVGQGLAGTLLAWECERAGISFAIADAGHADAASRFAAGIVTPITGRRFVKSWRIDTLLPSARGAYREIETSLGVALWREMRVRRLFADEKERSVAPEKHLRDELAPYVVKAPDAEGFWIEGAGRVDVPALLSATRAHWRANGRLHEEVFHGFEDKAGKFDLIIDCRGLAGARDGAFGFVPWEFSKGQILSVAVEGLAAEVVLNRGHWALPIAPGIAWIGATHEPHFTDLTPDAAGRKQLEESAAKLLGPPFSVTGHFAGVRVNLPDKRPVAGRHPANQQLGICNGLGAKGALWAPMLARQWVNHLTEGVPFDAELAVERFWSREILRT